MSHLRHSALLLFALAPAWPSAAADPSAPVIPPPGATAAADQALPTQGAVPAGAAQAGTAPAVTAGEPMPSPAMAIPAPELTGAWQAIEVVVFDRPLVGLEPKGELLSSDAPRAFPAALTSLDAPGTEGSVFYPADPRDTACHLRFAMPAMAPPDTANQIPAAFTESAGSLREEAAAAEAGAAAANETAPAEAGGEPALEVPPDPAAELRAALADYEAGLVEQSLTWLPASANGLAAAARRLEQQGGYRVLFHRTWIQNLARRTPAPTVLVQSARDADATALLEGSLRVQRSRGTRFDATLWYRPAADRADSSYIPISASRRLGNGEVVYVDHPKLGIVVRAVEVGVPAAIMEAWQTLATTPPVTAPESPANAPAQAAPAPGGTAPAVSRPAE